MNILKAFRIIVKETLLQTKGNLELYVKCLLNCKRVSVCCNKWKTNLLYSICEHLVATYFSIKKIIY